MRFCSACAQPVHRAVPAGEDRERYVCGGCSTIHYENPRVVAGCIVERAGCILLCRRAIEPQRGRWTIPAGFLEIGEGLPDGAKRETREETGAEVTIRAPHSNLDLPAIGQVYVVFRASPQNDAHGPTAESLEVAYVPIDAIPWHDLAFAVVKVGLQLYVDDLRAGTPRMHHGAVHEGQLLDHWSVALAASA